MAGYHVASSSIDSRRSPAPGGLEMVRSLLNTHDIEAGTDHLATATGVDAWLGERGLADPSRGEGVAWLGVAGPGVTASTEADRDRLVSVREAIRAVLVARHDRVAPSADTRATLHAAGQTSPLVVDFTDGGGTTLRPVGLGIDGVFGRVLAEVATAVMEGTWDRLKVCANDACRWAYYDASRNRSGVWCSMAVCGNRLKGRAFRRRRVANGEVS